MHNLPHRVGVARFQLCKSSVHKRFMSVDSTPPKCSHLWLSSANQNFRALHLVFQGGSALFMPPCKNFHHHCTLHLPFCEFTSKMVGGFLFLQARSCFLKFFRFVAFLSHFPANFQYIKTEKPTICTAFSTVNRGFSFGALEGTRIPGPLIKSQMLYRLSYERIFSDLQILPNYITTPAPKKQEESAKKCLSAAHRPPPGERPFLL